MFTNYPKLCEINNFNLINQMWIDPKVLTAAWFTRFFCLNRCVEWNFICILFVVWSHFPTACRKPPPNQLKHVIELRRYRIWIRKKLMLYKSQNLIDTFILVLLIKCESTRNFTIVHVFKQNSEVLTAWFARFFCLNRCVEWNFMCILFVVWSHFPTACRNPRPNQLKHVIEVTSLQNLNKKKIDDL